jgi:putative ABC transport system substrate-binding protein
VNRRSFITLIGGAAAWPLAARAQQMAIPVVGYLGLTSADADAYVLASFRKGLSEAGFDDGRNVTIDYRFAERDVSRLPALAAEFVTRKVTVVFTATTVSALAMKAATSTIPLSSRLVRTPLNRVLCQVSTVLEAISLA